MSFQLNFLNTKRPQKLINATYIVSFNVKSFYINFRSVDTKHQSIYKTRIFPPMNLWGCSVFYRKTSIVDRSIFLLYAITFSCCDYIFYFHLFLLNYIISLSIWKKFIYKFGESRKFFVKIPRKYDNIRLYNFSHFPTIVSVVSRPFSYSVRVVFHKEENRFNLWCFLIKKKR